MDQMPYLNAQSAKPDPKVTALRQLLGMDNQGQPIPQALGGAPPKKRKKPSAQPNLPRKPVPQRPAGHGGW